MFDFHLHTKLSFDSETEPQDVVAAAERLGLREICFTDHFDQNSEKELPHNIIMPEDYKSAIFPVVSETVKIRRGIEFGLTEWNQKYLPEFASALALDFVIGSVHYINGLDPYVPEYWVDKNQAQAFEDYLLAVLKRVRLHDSFDVLGHVNYVCKSPNNPTHEPLKYDMFPDLIDEIFKEVIAKGKGIEVNTSGKDRLGDFLPDATYLKRFKELGGEIVTVGSDGHTTDRVGQYSSEASKLVADIFGYVCTFEKRKPVFHKI